LKNFFVAPIHDFVQRVSLAVVAYDGRADLGIRKIGVRQVGFLYFYLSFSLLVLNSRADVYVIK
jgi:hypothetical protein